MLFVFKEGFQYINVKIIQIYYEEIQNILKFIMPILIYRYEHIQYCTEELCKD